MCKDNERETLLHLIQKMEGEHPEWDEERVAEELRREIREHEVVVLGNQDT